MSKPARSRWLKGIAIAAVVGLGCLTVWALVCRHEAYLRSVQNQRVATALQAALPAGTRRIDADRYLKAHGYEFSEQWGPGTVQWDDFVRFGGHEPEWFPCSYSQPAVLVRFGPHPPATQPGPPHPVFPMAQPDDVVTGMEYRLWPMDCL